MIKKKCKKLLAMILVLCLCVGVFPTSALAYTCKTSYTTTYKDTFGGSATVTFKASGVLASQDFLVQVGNGAKVQPTGAFSKDVSGGSFINGGVTSTHSVLNTAAYTMTVKLYSPVYQSTTVKFYDAKSGKQVASQNITIGRKFSIKFLKSSISVKKGDYTTVKFSATGPSGQSATSYIWEHGSKWISVSSSNKNIVSPALSSAGTVKMKGLKKGTATVVLKSYDGSTTSVKVTVK